MPVDCRATGPGAEDELASVLEVMKELLLGVAGGTRSGAEDG